MIKLMEIYVDNEGVYTVQSGGAKVHCLEITDALEEIQEQLIREQEAK